MLNMFINRRFRERKGLFIVCGIVLLLLTNCSNYPSDVKQNLKLAGSNKPQLLEVIRHFHEEKDSLKLQAAYYLIGNMQDKYSVSGSNLVPYFNILNEVDKLKNSANSDESLDKIMSIKRDSVLSNFGNFDRTDLKITSDLESITSEFLIRNIDLAFEVWKLPWAMHVPYEVFCETILPYRINDEPLSNWREVFLNKYLKSIDTTGIGVNPIDLLILLNKDFRTRWNHFYGNVYSSFGYYPDLLMMDSLNGGTCENRYFLFIGICRSIGLPVAIDYTTHWTITEGGHSWCVLYDRGNRYRPFNGGEENIYLDDKNLVPMEGGFIGTKVYRKMYKVQNIDSKIKDDLFPLNFDVTRCIDVTAEYDFKKYSCTYCNLDSINGKVAFILAANNGMRFNPVAWTVIEKGKAIFGELGAPAFYVPALINKKGTIEMINRPLLIKVDNPLPVIYNPNLLLTDTVRLWRKYFPSIEFQKFANYMVQGKFQGSNDETFSNAVDLFSIQSPPLYFKESKVNTNRRFRFLRYIQDNGFPIRIAEIAFFGLDSCGDEVLLSGKTISNLPESENSDSIQQLVFDNNIRTNFNADSGVWIGLDLGKSNAIQVSKVAYLPRNNFNVIEIGHKYELFYLDPDLNWKSIDTKIADNYFIDFYEVPYESMLLLKNHTAGKQERIFLYDPNLKTQNWW